MMTCVAVDDEPMALDVIADHCARSGMVELKATFREPLKAITYLEQQQIDLLFLDINMPQVSGMQMANLLSPSPMIIFTTAYSHYAVESYNINAVDYLLKPIIFERFLTAVKKAVQVGLRSNMTSDAVVYLKSGTQIHAVQISDILYLEKECNYMTVHLKVKQILIRENMSDIFEVVPASDFVRVHKSYVVSIRHITTVEAHQLTINQRKIPVGSTYRESVVGRLGWK